ncbi:MAG TPA: cupin domain-containing protein [Bryobacteraceae bacterium]|nr:cupin domain-containing protein [Bryobacteraceae bacterium]
MKLHRWRDIAVEQMNPLVTRQVVHSDSMTIARLNLRQGAIVPRHHHVNEQVANVERGRLRFVFDDREAIVEGGESMQIASNVPHMVEALEDSVVVDLFSPVREDWLRGDDAYLRR